MRRSNPRMYVPVPTARSATVKPGDARPVGKVKALSRPQCVVDKADHQGHHFWRGVVGTGLRPQGVVVLLQELLAKTTATPRACLCPLPTIGPHRVRERAYPATFSASPRCLRRRSAVGARTRSACSFTKLSSNLIQATGETDALCTCHQEPERDRLRIAVRERLVRRLRKQQLAPVRPQVRQSRRSTTELFDNLVAE